MKLFLDTLMMDLCLKFYVKPIFNNEAYTNEYKKIIQFSFKERDMYSKFIERHKKQKYIFSFLMGCFEEDECIKLINNLYPNSRIENQKSFHDGLYSDVLSRAVDFFSSDEDIINFFLKIKSETSVSNNNG